jgi:hypothetical protein
LSQSSTRPSGIRCVGFLRSASSVVDSVAQYPHTSLHQGQRTREHNERTLSDGRRVVTDSHIVAFRCVRPHGSEPVELLFGDEAAAADFVASVSRLSPSASSPSAHGSSSSPTMRMAAEIFFCRV